MNHPNTEAAELAQPQAFAERLIAWQRREGRHGLPWQGTRDPYRVWLSEVMLQQTQVSTVLTYFPRFLARFPNVKALAVATPDEVMAQWSGLGYYSRARNLHRCAQMVVDQYGGVFPADASTLLSLPGLGASTAAAIAAFCHGQRISILDGNVRRVLTRLLAFGDDLAKPAAQRALWAHAQALLPDDPQTDDMAAYTQGLMDLGATVCTRSRPQCQRCPVVSLCTAGRDGTASAFPVKTRSLARRHESWWLLLLRRQGAQGPWVWLQRRPTSGIWAGLYCPPVFTSEAQALTARPVGADKGVLQALESVAHSLTHRELRLYPLLLDVKADGDSADWQDPGGLSGLGEGQWMAWAALETVGLPAPVRNLLQRLPPAPVDR